MSRSFNGSSEYITFPNVTYWTPNHDSSVAFWFYPTGTNEYAGLVINSAFKLYFRTSKKLAMYGWITVDPFTMTAITLSTWNHVAVTCKGTAAQAFNLYLNGSNIYSNATGSSGTGSSGTTWIGADTPNNPRYFTGRMADLAIWNDTILTADEVTNLAKGARPARINNPTNLVLYAPLDGLASPEIDLSKYARNGTLTNACAAADGPPINMFTRRWPINSAAPSFIPAWAAQSNLPVIGAGTL